LLYCTFAYQGSEKCCYERKDLRDGLITKYAPSETVDSQLTLIFRMRQRAFRYCFCQYRVPILDKGMAATDRNMNYPRCKAKNGSCAIDAHFQDAAGSMSLLLMPVKAANC